MKKQCIILIFVISAIFLLTACGCKHEWNEATCIAPQTCSICQKTKGDITDHNWTDATCVDAKTCVVCKTTEGSPLGHSWNNATCTSPKTCSVCNETEGNVLEHAWVEATVETPKTCALCKKTEGDALSIADFEATLLELPLYVESTRYIIQTETYRALYPDLMSAIIVNNSGTSIKDAVLAFVAWDKNNFPIKIHGYNDFGEETYVKTCVYDDVNMLHGDSYGDGIGMPVDFLYMDEVATFKAIVKEYTDFDGNTWTNPYFNTWCSLYENKILTQ